MTDKQKATQEKPVPFDVTSCMAMMEKMMAQFGEGCDCTGIMAQMMGTCCGTQSETKEKDTAKAKATQKA